MDVRVRMSGLHHRLLEEHLFPGDGAEAVALALCGRHVGSAATVLLVQRIHLVPYAHCTRAPDALEWSTDELEGVLAEAARENLSVLKVHSHPGGFEGVSVADDQSDAEVFGAVRNWTRSSSPHASLVMLPGGRMFGRAFVDGESTGPVKGIAVAGDDIHFWDRGARAQGVPEFARRHGQVFGEGTTNLLRRRSIGVAGCSGTGSPLIEQLGRYGPGRIVLVDPEPVEEVNLGRIVNASREDADRGRPKVEVQGRALRRMDLGTSVELVPHELSDPEAIRALAGCDIIFGCVDSVEGRHLLSLISTCFVQPYLDVGVHITADGDGGVSEVCGAVHYLQPGGATLLGREVYSREDLEADVLSRSDPEEFARRRREGYLHGVRVSRPAVVSVNSLYSSFAAIELLARLHPFRSKPNRGYACSYLDLVTGLLLSQPEPEVPCELAYLIGRGDIEPLLGLPALRASA